MESINNLIDKSIHLKDTDDFSILIHDCEELSKSLANLVALDLIRAKDKKNSKGVEAILLRSSRILNRNRSILKEIYPQLS